MWQICWFLFVCPFVCLMRKKPGATEGIPSQAFTLNLGCRHVTNHLSTKDYKHRPLRSGREKPVIEGEPCHQSSSREQQSSALHSQPRSHVLALPYLPITVPRCLSLGKREEQARDQPSPLLWLGGGRSSLCVQAHEAACIKLHAVSLLVLQAKSRFKLALVPHGWTMAPAPSFCLR